MLRDVETSQRGRKHLLRTIIPACHPDGSARRGVDIGQQAISQSMSKIATALLGAFDEKELWNRPREWSKHVGYMIHANQL
jgi:hypothetical protein